MWSPAMRWCNVLRHARYRPWPLTISTVEMHFLHRKKMVRSVFDFIHCKTIFAEDGFQSKLQPLAIKTRRRFGWWLSRKETRMMFISRHSASNSIEDILICWVNAVKESWGRKAEESVQQAYLLQPRRYRISGSVFYLIGHSFTPWYTR